MNLQNAVEEKNIEWEDNPLPSELSKILKYSQLSMFIAGVVITLVFIEDQFHLFVILPIMWWVFILIILLMGAKSPNKYNTPIKITMTSSNLLCVFQKKTHENIKYKDICSIVTEPFYNTYTIEYIKKIEKGFLKICISKYKLKTIYLNEKNGRELKVIWEKTLKEL